MIKYILSLFHKQQKEIRQEDLRIKIPIGYICFTIGCNSSYYSLKEARERKFYCSECFRKLNRV
jgi:transcription initiation factor IIE alpha subunit